MSSSKQTTAKTTTTTTTRQSPAKKKAAGILASVKNLSAKDVLDEVTRVQLSVQSQLAGLGANITNQIDRMKDLDVAIAEKEGRLKELFEIEEEALAIDAMQQKHLDEQAVLEKKAADNAAQWQEDENERAKRWKREDEERAYAVLQRTKRADEEFAASVQERKRVEALRQQDLERAWAEKTAELAEQQGELTELRARVSQFEEEKKKEIAKEVAIETNRIKKDNEHSLQLLQKDTQSEKQLSAARELSLKDQIKNLEQLLSQVSKDLEKTRQDAKEVTQEALKSASSRDALGAVQQMQASNSQKK